MYVKLDALASTCDTTIMTDRTSLKSNGMAPSEARINVWAKLIRVSQNLLQDVEKELKKAGLPPLAWYDVLLELKRVEKHGLRPYQLQGSLLIAQYNLSRLIDKMVKAGFIEKEICKIDGRGHSLKITPAGFTLQEKMWPIYQQAVQDHFSVKLDDNDIQSLDDIFKKLQNDNDFPKPD